MALQTTPLDIEGPQFVPVTQADLDRLRTSCEARIARGGEVGEISSEILSISDDLTALINKLGAFLKS